MTFRHIEDYYDKVHERFPDLEIWEIDKILKHGMQSLFTLNSYGADVLVESSPNSFVAYFGKLFINKELSWKYFNIKSKIKYRIKYLRNKPIWDGYYYFGLSEEEYQKYIPKKKGRIKNKITFEKLGLYKIKEEAFLPRRFKYFYKVKLDEEKGLSCIVENFSTRNIELFAIRDTNNKIKYTYE